MCPQPRAPTDDRHGFGPAEPGFLDAEALGPPCEGGEGASPPRPLARCWPAVGSLATKSTGPLGPPSGKAEHYSSLIGVTF